MTIEFSDQFSQELERRLPKDLVNDEHGEAHIEKIILDMIGDIGCTVDVKSGNKEERELFCDLTFKIKG